MALVDETSPSYAASPSDKLDVESRVAIDRQSLPAFGVPGVVLRKRVLEAFFARPTTDYRGHHHGFTHQRMISRAYHDSLFMSRVAPAAMLFIACGDGASHRPDE